MKAGRMPRLQDTGRRYLEETRRARLANPGLERFVRSAGRGRHRLVLALALLAALMASMIWLTGGR
jgi:hypothetical protein